jgi:hypothetical protein
MDRQIWSLSPRGMVSLDLLGQQAQQVQVPSEDFTATVVVGPIFHVRSPSKLPIFVSRNKKLHLLPSKDIAKVIRC